MKKIIFSIASATLSLFGLSAFKTAKTTDTKFYWIYILDPITRNQHIVKGSEVGLVTVNGYFGYYGTILNATPDTVADIDLISLCESEGSDYCLVGFTINPQQELTVTANLSTLVAITIPADPESISNRN